MTKAVKNKDHDRSQQVAHEHWHTWELFACLTGLVREEREWKGRSVLVPCRRLLGVPFSFSNLYDTPPSGDFEYTPCSHIPAYCQTARKTLVVQWGQSCQRKPDFFFLLDWMSYTGVGLGTKVLYKQIKHSPVCSFITHSFRHTHQAINKKPERFAELPWCQQRNFFLGE